MMGIVQLFILLGDVKEPGEGHGNLDNSWNSQNHGDSDALGLYFWSNRRYPQLLECSEFLHLLIMYRQTVYDINYGYRRAASS